MIRVTRTDEATRTTLAIDGRLECEYVEAVETCCDQALSAGKPVYLYLRDVSTVDSAGRALLGRVADRGVHLWAAGVYTSYLVRQITSGVRFASVHDSEESGDGTPLSKHEVAPR